MNKKLFLAGLFCLVSFALQAQKDDLGLWTSVGMEKRFLAEPQAERAREVGLCLRRVDQQVHEREQAVHGEDRAQDGQQRGTPRVVHVREPGLRAALAFGGLVGGDPLLAGLLRLPGGLLLGLELGVGQATGGRSRCCTHHIRSFTIIIDSSTRTAVIVTSSAPSGCSTGRCRRWPW